MLITREKEKINIPVFRSLSMSVHKTGNQIPKPNGFKTKAQLGHEKDENVISVISSCQSL